MKKKKTMTSKDHYYEGYYTAWSHAMGALIRQNGQQGEDFAKEIMACFHITVEDMEEAASIDPIDLVPIRDGWKAYDEKFVGDVQ